MKRLLQAFTERRFWMNLFLVAIAVFIIVQLTLFWLNSYTRHGETITVPDLYGMDIAQVDEMLQNRDLSFLITDSIYSETLTKGAVVSQNPAGDMKVKKGRTIFLTVNSMLPEMVLMPDLMGKSLRIAIPLLEIAGLKLEVLEYKPDDTCTDCVLGFKHQGVEIEPGSQIRKGEKIVLILGRQSNIETPVPSLLGLTYSASAEALVAQSLNMGDILLCSGCETAEDSSSAFVMNQNPARGQMVKLGSLVDVYLSTDTAVANMFSAPQDSSDYEMD